MILISPTQRVRGRPGSLGAADTARYGVRATERVRHVLVIWFGWQGWTRDCSRPPCRHRGHGTGHESDLLGLRGDATTGGSLRHRQRASMGR